MIANDRGDGKAVCDYRLASRKPTLIHLARPNLLLTLMGQACRFNQRGFGR